MNKQIDKKVAINGVQISIPQTVFAYSIPQNVSEAVKTNIPI